MKTLAYIFCFLLAVTGPGFMMEKYGRAPMKTVRIHFHHTAGSKEIVLGEPLQIISGDTVTIERFRYYVSNFSVRDDKNNLYKLPVDYFLIDEETPGSKIISLTVPDIAISEINFMIGVDSIRNVSGIQTGALDPMKGMFWTWNSGYVMAKLEGTAEIVNSPGNRFTFHVGGFRTGMNVVKSISLQTGSLSKNNEIHIGADINYWFKGSTEIKISETPVCHSPGALAMKLADNYSHMFFIYTAHQ